MQRLEVSGAARHIYIYIYVYIYVVRRQRVNNRIMFMKDLIMVILYKVRSLIFLRSVMEVQWFLQTHIRAHCVESRLRKSIVDCLM
jgi:hypothetical protein